MALVLYCNRRLFFYNCYNVLEIEIKFEVCPGIFFWLKYGIQELELKYLTLFPTISDFIPHLCHGFIL